MTKVKVSKKNSKIVGVHISGHAFYSEYGNDIVCSAISMLSYTIANKLIDIDEDNTKIDIKEGSFNIFNKNNSSSNELLFETLLMGFEMLEKEYKDNIKIEEG